MYPKATIQSSLASRARGARLGIRSRVTRTLLAFVTALSAASVWSQAYPARTVRVVVPYAPGGGSDILGRLVSAKVGEMLGQQFVLDNRPGGGSTIGTQVVARAVPDGYTIGVIDTAFTINPGLVAKLPYDTTKDLIPITMVATSPLLLLVHPSLPAKTAAELIALGKARPGQLTFSSAGPGAASHLAGELFADVTGVKLNHVPYKSAGQAATALLSGEITMSFILPASTAAYVKAGRLRALVTSGDQRYAGLPDVPTFNEAGLQKARAEAYWGVVAPAGTPQSIVERLNDAYAKQINMPEMKRRLVEMAFVPANNTPAEFAAFIRQDIDK